MKKVMILYGVLSSLQISADYAQEQHEQEFVILRTAQVLPKRQVDSINIDLGYLQHYHDALYDALCLTLIMDPNRVVYTRYVSILHDLSLIDEHHRMKDEVEMVLEARLLDNNSNNPSPYRMLCVDQEIVIGNSNDDSDPER